MKAALILVLSLFVLGALSAQSESQDTKCGTCQFVVQIVEGFVNKDTTKEKVMTFLKRACKLSAGFKSQCEAIIDAKGPVLIDLILKHLSPETVCTKVKLCSAQAEAALNVFLSLPEEAFEESFLEPQASAGLCSGCEYVVKVAEEYIASNATETQVLEFLETACAIAGPYEAQCVAIIKAKGAQVYEYILKKESPSVLCQQLSLCPAPSPLAVSARLNVHADAAGLCPECEFVVQIAESYVGKNATAIVGFLDKACALAPSPYNAECKAIVDSEGPKLITELLKKESPEVVCAQIKLCPKPPPSPSPSSPARLIAPQAFPVDSCELCGLVAKVAEEYVRNGANEKMVLSYLAKVCDYLPSPYGSLCAVAVSTEAPKLLHQLATKQIPALCEKLNLCKAKTPKVEAMVAISSGTLCATCDFVIKTAEAYISNNSTTAEIISFLEASCSVAGPYAATCTAAVKAKGPQLIQWIIQKESPEVVCSQLTLCPKPSPTKVFFANN